MLVGLLLLALGIWSAGATINALRPFRHPLVLLPSMFWSWFVIGSPVQHLLSQILIAGVLIWLGALDHLFGSVGLGILAVSWIGTAVLIIRMRGAKGVVDTALANAGVAPFGKSVSFWRTLAAVPIRGHGVERIKDVPFRRVAGRVLKLDVFRDRSERTDRPVLIYIHGGGWVMGDKREQGLPLLHHFARNGWLCFSLNYRLSPGATFPDHLEDAKAGLAWVKAHASEYGGDASFVAISGGSAGGHLAAMIGLTENETRYQPGFEDADTSIQAVVPIYGIYDMTNRMSTQSPQFVSLLLEPVVIKAFIADEPEKFHAASPIDHVHSDAPPFLIVQGDNDTLAPVVETRAFVDRLSGVAKERVLYMEFPGAQHIFDLGYSYQSSRMVEGVLAVLEDEYQRSTGSTPG
ncbi:MAG: alpha/beta hydrolase [Actinomycetia bacterium]|nr:alpha/beta hydrolase [Actinomycetes bacterium]